MHPYPLFGAFTFSGVRYAAYCGLWGFLAIRPSALRENPNSPTAGRQGLVATLLFDPWMQALPIIGTKEIMGAAVMTARGVAVFIYRVTLVANTQSLLLWLTVRWQFAEARQADWTTRPGEDVAESFQCEADMPSIRLSVGPL